MQTCNVAIGKPELRRRSKPQLATAVSRTAVWQAQETALGILPISRGVAEIVICENRDIAKAAISNLIETRQVAERMCRLSGRTVLVDRRPSYRNVGTSHRQLGARHG